MKMVLRLDVGRWSRILRVWEIVNNRDLTPDDNMWQILKIEHNILWFALTSAIINSIKSKFYSG